MTKPFESSSTYWESRYRLGGDSGKGSYGELAEFKASVLNAFVAHSEIESVIEFGCGDGNQLTLAKYKRYVGYDVSSTAVEQCKRLFSEDKSKEFHHVSEYSGQMAQLVLSLDVLFHLVEDDVFDAYMHRLFHASSGYVVIYCSCEDRPINPRSPHVRHRRFTDWVKEKAPNFTLVETIPNPFRGGTRTKEGHGSPSDFYFYMRA